MNDKNYLAHYGVKGMKWGHRKKYYNSDGSLTDAGKKKASKAYKKAAVKVSDELNRNGNKMYVNAYNKAADKMNKGGIEKFNQQQEKKYGKDYANREGYAEAYMKMFEKEVNMNMNKSLHEFYSTNTNAKKAQALVDEYGMDKWDDLARRNTEKIQELRAMFEHK